VTPRPQLFFRIVVFNVTLVIGILLGEFVFDIIWPNSVLLTFVVFTAVGVVVDSVYGVAGDTANNERQPDFQNQRGVG